MFEGNMSHSHDDLAKNGGEDGYLFSLEGTVSDDAIALLERLRRLSKSGKKFGITLARTNCKISFVRFIAKSVGVRNTIRKQNKGEVTLKMLNQQAQKGELERARKPAKLTKPTRHRQH